MRRRESVLRRDHYQCRECVRYGRHREATTVHHLIPLWWCLEHHPALALDQTNLLSLCSACHNKMHKRASKALTPLGQAWVERKFSKNIFKKYF